MLKLRNFPSRHRKVWLSLAVATGLCSAAILSGCASSRGVDAHAQPVLAQQQLPMQRVANASPLARSNAWPQQDWWKGLHDAQLDQLMDRALQHNPTLAQAQARLHAAQAQADGAGANRGPTWGIAAGYSGVRLPEVLVPRQLGGGKFAYESNLISRFQWDLDLWGGKRAAWQAAVGEEQAVAIDAQAARIALASAIVRSYAQLHTAYAMHDIAAADVQRTEQLQTLELQRVQQGLDNQIPLQATRGELAGAMQRQQGASQSIAHLQLVLAQLAALPPDAALDIQRPSARFDTSAWLHTLPDDLPVNLLAHRPDVVAARLRVEAASRNIEAAKAQFLPNISLGALAGAVGDKHFNLFHLPNVFYQFGPSISLPLFENGRLRANLSGQNARYEAAVATYNQKLLDAIHQVADAVSTSRTLHGQIAQQQQATAAIRTSYQLLRQRRGQGLANALQVLQMQQQLLQAEQRSAQLQAQLIDNALQLNQALGGGYTA